MFDPDLVLIGGWENNFCYSCERVFWRSVSSNAYCKGVHQESVFELFPINQVNRDYSDPIGLCSAFFFSPLFFCVIVSQDVILGLIHKLTGSWWWTEMGPSLLEWWPRSHGFTEWDGDFEFLWYCKLSFYTLSHIHSPTIPCLTFALQF